MEASGDPDLIARARGEDRAAFEELLRPVIDSAARLAFGMLQDQNAAEDVVQEAALKAWRRLGNLHTGSDFRPWFFGIVTNQSRSLRRTRWRSVLRLGRTEISVQPDVEEVASRAVDLRRALRRLPTDQLAAILLHFYLDLPLDAVAATLGISTAGVKSRINRGLKRLRYTIQIREAAI